MYTVTAIDRISQHKQKYHHKTLDDAVRCLRNRFLGYTHIHWTVNDDLSVNMNREYVEYLCERQAIDDSLVHIIRRTSQFLPYTFRDGPVPCVHRRWKRYYHTHYRRVKHKQKFVHETRDRPPLHIWDEYPRHLERNWKRYRKTQYK